MALVAETVAEQNPSIDDVLKDSTEHNASGQDHTMVLNMGPQHPSTHGVLRLVLEIDAKAW